MGAQADRSNCTFMELKYDPAAYTDCRRLF